MQTEGEVDGTRKARILIVDDHPVVRHGLGQLINQQSDLTVCGEAVDAPEALKAVKHLHPDVAIVDISLNKGTDGLDLIEEIRDKHPHVLVLVLSMHDRPFFADRALRAGARGYVMKEEAVETVLSAIRHILQGGTWDN